VNGTAKPIRRKDRTAEKRQPIPSGLAGTAPHRRAFRFGFPRCLFSWRVLVAAARQRRRSRIKDKHTPRLQMAFSKVNLSSRIFCRRRVKMHLKLAASR